VGVQDLGRSLEGAAGVVGDGAAPGLGEVSADALDQGLVDARLGAGDGAGGLLHGNGPGLRAGMIPRWGRGGQFGLEVGTSGQVR
jgi:hypothetical protein